MEKLTNWYKMWEELSDIQSRAFARQNQRKGDDFWEHKAKHFEKMVNERWAKPDSSRDFLIQRLKNNPDSTLLDIGAGTGKWSMLASPFAGQVTALEPSFAMQKVLKEKIEIEKVTNIDIVTGTWPEDDVSPHDYVLASHSMYGVGHFKAFVDKMSDTATKGCMMVLRVPFADSVMAVAASEIFGQPYDSPNLQIAYNALMGMDIYPDVIMEEAGNWAAWTNDSFAEALDDLKNRLDIAESSKYDKFLSGLLDKHLTLEKGKYVWPVGNRSALIYWAV